MNEIVGHLARHGYSVLFASVFARQLCLPIPAILFLLAAGALAGNGKLNLALVVCFGVIACVLADLVWFEAGRLRGNDVVHFIHRFSSKSDSNAVRTKKLFARYGTKALLIAKFVIGLDAIAPPLAGMSGTSLPRFVSFDGAGATLWAGFYAGLGYIFYQQLDKAAAYAARMGAVLTAIVLLLEHNRRQDCPHSRGVRSRLVQLLVEDVTESGIKARPERRSGTIEGHETPQAGA